jgi:hypothetical protein
MINKINVDSAMNPMLCIYIRDGIEIGEPGVGGGDVDSGPVLPEKKRRRTTRKTQGQRKGRERYVEMNGGIINRKSIRVSRRCNRQGESQKKSRLTRQPMRTLEERPRKLVQRGRYGSLVLPTFFHRLPDTFCVFAAVVLVEVGSFYIRRRRGIRVI